MSLSTGLDERLVFFHDADVVDRGAEALGRVAELFDVSVPAYPGFEGQFEAVDRAWETWDSAADLAHHFRDTLCGPGDPRPLHVGGAGLGGWVALEMALMSPSSLESLVLVAPYGVKLFGRMERDFADVLLLDAEEQLERGWADPSRCTGIRMPGFPKDLPDSQHEIAFAERATLARYVWKPFLYSRSLTRWVGSIDTPTLIVAGESDAMLHEGHSRALAARMPNATFVEIPDAGHYPYLEQPDAFFDAVSDFYRDLKG
jgi:pimeloyl-ACP methyl ester carboxylesterase